jgi:prepilin-type N-terminal cleavage/methylation domain-containing protein
MNRRAFTLIEMLLATVLVAVMMGGVLMLLGGVNRDVRTMRGLTTQSNDSLIDLISHDLVNASSFRVADDGRVIQIVGNTGIERRSLRSDGRLARVVYRVEQGSVLRREQVYLDDPGRPQPWSELAGVGIDGLAVVRDSDNARRGRLVIATRQGGVVRELRLQ